MDAGWKCLHSLLECVLQEGKSQLPWPSLACNAQLLEPPPNISQVCFACTHRNSPSAVWAELQLTSAGQSFLSAHPSFLPPLPGSVWFTVAPHQCLCLRSPHFTLGFGPCPCSVPLPGQEDCRRTARRTQGFTSCLNTMDMGSSGQELRQGLGKQGSGHQSWLWLHPLLPLRLGLFVVQCGHSEPVGLSLGCPLDLQPLLPQDSSVMISSNRGNCLYLPPVGECQA